MRLFQICLLNLGLALCATANGGTITFEDVQGIVLAPSFIVIPNGYDGFNWNNFNVVDTSAISVPTGYQVGTISGNNVAYNAYGDPASITSATPFYLESGYFTAAWKNGLILNVVGRNGGKQEFNETFTLSAINTSFLTFPQLPLTELDFSTSGGDDFHTPYGGDTPQMAMDNLTVASIPDAASTAALLASSVGGLVWLRKRLAYD